MPDQTTTTADITERVRERAVEQAAAQRSP